jgi:GxxExxY protein
MQTRNLNDISYLIIQCAIEVHRALGPGLLESVYRACVMYELRQRQLGFVAEQLVPICYKGVVLDSAYRLDMLVEDQIVVEVKAVETVLPVHEAQLLSYLRLMDKPLGLLINFNVPLLTDGVTRRMNGFHVAALHTKEPTPNAPEKKTQPVRYSPCVSVSPCLRVGMPPCWDASVR